MPELATLVVCGAAAGVVVAVGAVAAPYDVGPEHLRGAWPALLTLAAVALSLWRALPRKPP